MTMSVNQAMLKPVVESSVRSNDLTISIYENEVPAFVEAALENLYENLYSSLIQLEVHGRTDNLSTYVATEYGKETVILLFRMESGRARVLNNVIKMDESVVARFASALFDRFKSINVIVFETVQTNIRRLAFPYQRFNSSEDIVLTLPRSSEEYVANLGKNTRKNVKYYLNRVKRNFPSFEFKLYEKEAVSEAQVLDILRLKSNRLAGKNMSTAHHDSETEKILRLVKARGLVGIISINGQVCAGSIGYRVGTNSFGGVLAHDLEYDGYWIGMLCLYLTICECIALGCSEHHFLWGQDEFKYRMLGVQRDLDDITIYRSRTQYVLNVVTACKAASKGYVRRSKLWLREAKTRDDHVGKLLSKLTRRKVLAG